jgi:hypothetical protein
MPDFKDEVRQSIAELNLSPEREVEIVEELSQDLEERFEKALSEGVSEEKAKQLALQELVEPDSLGAQLKRVKMPSRSPSLAIGATKTRQRFAGFWDDIRFGLRILRKQPGFCGCRHHNSRHRNWRKHSNVELSAGCVVTTSAVRPFRSALRNLGELGINGANEGCGVRTGFRGLPRPKPIVCSSG